MASEGWKNRKRMEEQNTKQGNGKKGHSHSRRGSTCVNKHSTSLWQRSAIIRKQRHWSFVCLYVSVCACVFEGGELLHQPASSMASRAFSYGLSEEFSYSCSCVLGSAVRGSLAVVLLMFVRVF